MTPISTKMIRLQPVRLLFTMFVFIFTLIPISDIYSQICTSNNIVAAYLPSYRDPSIVDYSKLTHAYFCFIGANADGSIASQSTYDKDQMSIFLDKCNTAGTQPIITLGNTSGLPTLAGSATARQKFADTLRKYCNHYGFVGADIDWEAIQTSTDRANYELFMGVLHDTLSKYSLKLVATVGFTQYWMQWYTNKALRYADWMQVMVYDQTGTWSASPFGNHSTFQHLLNAESYWKGRGFHKDSIVMGLPFYGYKFASTSGGVGTAYTYSAIVDQFPNMDECSNQTPCNDYDFFNGPNLIRKKVNYTIAQGYKGVFIWEIGQDITGPKSLHNAVWDEYTKACSGSTYDLCANDIEPCRTAVLDQAESLSGIIYDNGSGNIIIKEVNANAGEVIISDIMGRVVYQGQLQQDGNSGILHLPLTPGLYFMSLQNAKTIHRGRFIAR